MAQVFSCTLAQTTGVIILVCILQVHHREKKELHLVLQFSEEMAVSINNTGVWAFTHVLRYRIVL